jgi:hypothetical protein
MNRFRQAVPVALTWLGVAMAGCSQPPVHARRHAPPAPADVADFALGEPDAVLLITGGTNASMELCNCTGPMPGGLARRSGLLRSYRHAFDDVLAFDAGDATWIEPADVRNEYILRGYRRVGYDVLCLGDQEWAFPAPRLDRILQDAGLTCLSTTVQPIGKPNWPVREVVRLDTRRARLAMVTNLQRRWLLFFPPERLDELRFVPTDLLAERCHALRTEGRTVVLVCHGDDKALDETLEACRPDLAVRGHTSRTVKDLYEVQGVPVVRVGSGDYVGALAMTTDDDGRIEALEYRAELVADRWPVDRRLIQLYQAFVHRMLRTQWDRSHRDGRPVDHLPPASCGQCHQRQLDAWRRGPHARSLRSIQAAGRQDDRDCLACHTTDAQSPGGFVSRERTPALGAVTCQACHRFDLDEHRREDFAEPPADRSVCTTCHTPVTSPGFAATFAHRRGFCPARDK